MISTYDAMLAKEDLGIGKLIYVQIGKRDFLFRQISLKEYVQCKILTSSQEELNDAICQITLVHSFIGNDFEFSVSPIATIGDICAPIIIENSYINQQRKVIELLEDYRDKTKNFTEQCAMLIKSAFPEYPIEEIYNWNFDKMMDILAKAEFILSLKLGREIKLDCDIDEEALEMVHTDRELLDQGIDLIMHYGKDNVYRHSIFDYPIIIGNDWNNEEVLKGARQQILKRQRL